MENNIQAVTDLLHAIALYPLIGLDIWFGLMLVKSFRRDNKFTPMTWKEYLYGTYAARSFLILCLLLTGALIFQHVWR